MSKVAWTPISATDQHELRSADNVRGGLLVAQYAPAADMPTCHDVHPAESGTRCWASSQGSSWQLMRE